MSIRSKLINGVARGDGSWQKIGVVVCSAKTCSDVGLALDQIPSRSAQFGRKLFGAFGKNDLRKEEVGSGLVMLEEGNNLCSELLHILRVHPYKLAEWLGDTFSTPVYPLLILKKRVVELFEEIKAFSHLGCGETPIVVTEASQANGYVWVTKLAP